MFCVKKETSAAIEQRLLPLKKRWQKLTWARAQSLMLERLNELER